MGRRIAAFALAVGLMCLPAAAIHAQGYQLDFDSMQTDVSELSGGDVILQGGTSPQQTFATADKAQLLPLAAIAACGNGMREEGEACDGEDLGSATCASFGFRTGTVSCSLACSVVTSECSDPIVSSSSSSSSAWHPSPSSPESHSSARTGGGERGVPAIPGTRDEGAGNSSGRSGGVSSRMSSAERASQPSSSALSSAMTSEEGASDDGAGQDPDASSSDDASASGGINPGVPSGMHGASPTDGRDAAGPNVFFAALLALAAAVMAPLGWTYRAVIMNMPVRAYRSWTKTVGGKTSSARSRSARTSPVTLRKRRMPNKPSSASHS